MESFLLRPVLLALLYPCAARPPEKCTSWVPSPYDKNNSYVSGPGSTMPAARCMFGQKACICSVSVDGKCLQCDQGGICHTEHPGMHFLQLICTCASEADARSHHERQRTTLLVVGIVLITLGIGVAAGCIFGRVRIDACCRDCCGDGTICGSLSPKRRSVVLAVAPLLLFSAGATVMALGLTNDLDRYWLGCGTLDEA